MEWLTIVNPEWFVAGQVCLAGFQVRDKLAKRCISYWILTAYFILLFLVSSFNIFLLLVFVDYSLR